MPADISESTPAETYKDLLHLNNSGNGADTTLRALYNGDGNATPLQLSTNKVAFDAGDGVLDNVVLTDVKQTYNDKGGINTATVDFDLSEGNVQKMTIDTNITSITFSGTPTSGDAYELTLIVEQGSGGANTITWGGSILWSGGSSPTVTASLGAIDIFKMFSTDGGTTWYAWTLGQDFS